MKTGEVGKKFRNGENSLFALFPPKNIYACMQDDEIKRIRWAGRAERMEEKVNS